MLGFGALSGSGSLIIGLTSEPLAYIAGAGLIGLGLAVAVVFSASLRAAATPDEMLGRVGGAGRTLVLGLQPPALIAFGVLVDTGGAGLAMVAMGTLAIAGSAAFAVLRDVRAAGLADGASDGPEDATAATLAAPQTDEAE